MKNRNRILRVQVLHKIDEMREDTSHLGEYSDRKTSIFSIDRAHSLGCAINTGKAPNMAAHTLYECGCCDNLHPWDFTGDCRDDTNRYAGYDDYAERNSISEDKVTVMSADERAAADLGEFCNCGDERKPRHELRYFNPSFNYVNSKDELIDDNTAKEVRKYVLQDYERMERLNAGDWYYIGVIAQAHVATPDTFGYTEQVIRSGGIWGIESDSDRSYLQAEEEEQLSELRGILKDFGFSTRQISAAFKNVERA